jgi:hypothetical protein
MISSIFNSLKAWICDVLGPVEVTPDAPGPITGGRSVSLYVREILESPSSGTSMKMDRLQVHLSFLVTTSGVSALEAGDDLAKLLFAAMMNKDIALDLTPVSAAEWSAFGVVPRPSFSFRIPLNHTLEKPAVKRVEKPLVIKKSPFDPPGNRTPSK